MVKLTRLATADEYEMLKASRWNTIEIKLANGRKATLCRVSYDLRVIKDKLLSQGVSMEDIDELANCVSIEALRGSDYDDSW